MLSGRVRLCTTSSSGRIVRMNFRLFLAIAFAANVMQGVTLVTVTGSAPFGFNGTVTAAGFSLSTTSTGVSISAGMADLTTGGPLSGTEGTVYLVNQVGAGTTSANNIAPPVTVSGLTATFASRSLFAGLTLTPGNYYLVWVPTSTVGGSSMTPEGASNPTVTFGAGVTDLGSTQIGGVPAVFGPASNLTGFSTPDNFFITVAGTEPAAANLINITGLTPFGFTGTVTAAAFSLSTTYTGVSISAGMADLTSGGPLSGTEGAVYLVNHVGAGTTSANNVASPVTVAGLTATFTSRTLFAGLTLTPGTYYIVWVPTSTVGGSSMPPEGASNPTATFGAGVTDLGSTQIGGVPAVFGPASNLTGFSTPDNFFITMSGILGSSSVPTLSIWGAAALAMLLAGLGLISLRLMRRREA